MYFEYITCVGLHLAAVQEIHGGFIGQCIARYTKTCILYSDLYFQHVEIQKGKHKSH